MMRRAGSAAQPVALVTGAARGIGKGIARILGTTAIPVYVSDRETRANRYSNLPGSIEETAEAINAHGGTGIPVVCDHRDDESVERLFARIEREVQALDILVLNAFDGNALAFGSAPFWELSKAHWQNMMESGVRGHLLAASLAAPRMIGAGRGLIVLTGYADPEADVLGNHLYYDLAMTATSRLAHTMAHDLAPHGVTVVAISPGFTRTEAIVSALGDKAAGADSVTYCGKAVKALWDDPHVGQLAGRTLKVADLAARYRFTDDEEA